MTRLSASTLPYSVIGWNKSVEASLLEFYRRYSVTCGVVRCRLWLNHRSQPIESQLGVKKKRERKDFNSSKRFWLLPRREIPIFLASFRYFSFVVRSSKSTGDCVFLDLVSSQWTVWKEPICGRLFAASNHRPSERANESPRFFHRIFIR